MSLERHRPDEASDLMVLPERKLKQPRRFAVILHNDDYTTMEFVVMALVRFFGKTETDAHRIMLEVHHHGRGLAGVYCRDVAETKAEQVEEAARAEGHPLRCTAEPFDGENHEAPRAE